MSVAYRQCPLMVIWPTDIFEHFFCKLQIYAMHMFHFACTMYTYAPGIAYCIAGIKPRSELCAVCAPTAASCNRATAIKFKIEKLKVMIESKQIGKSKIGKSAWRMTWINFHTDALTQREKFENFKIKQLLLTQ